jgi:hypothetical protein
MAKTAQSASASASAHAPVCESKRSSEQLVLREFTFFGGASRAPHQPLAATDAKAKRDLTVYIQEVCVPPPTHSLCGSQHRVGCAGDA